MKNYEVLFHFGAKKIKGRDIFITALVLNFIVSILNRVFKLKPEHMWSIIDEIGREFNINLINNLILQSPELIEERIKRDVDNAIQDYQDVVELESVYVDEPTWTDQKEGETPLGGELGFTYDFVVDLEEEKNEQG